MTPEQMREAAATKAIEASSLYLDREYEIYCRTIAARIRAIPITPPEPTMKDRIAWVPLGSGRMDHVNKILEAMREPTEAMIDAGSTLSPWHAPRKAVAAIYQAMIDAALAEK